MPPFPALLAELAAPANAQGKMRPATCGRLDVPSFFPVALRFVKNHPPLVILNVQGGAPRGRALTLLGTTSSLRRVSNMPFEINLALRYLRPKRTFVSVITVISILGVMLGVAVLIIVLSVMTGFERELRDRLLGFNSHLRIEQLNGPMVNYGEVAEWISQDARVRAVAPYVVGQLMMETQPMYGNPQFAFPFFRGVEPDPELEEKISALPSSILPGGEFDVRGNGVLIGSEMARRLGLRPGDLLNIYTMRDFRELKELLDRARHQEEITEGFLPTEFEVRGIFDAGLFEFNDVFLVCSLANAQDFYGMNDAAMGLMVMLHEPGLVREVRAGLGRRLGPGFYLTTWEEENAVLLDALQIEKDVMFFLLFFIMIVAAFGITSALITFVVQKTREIGILKALGASNGQIMSIFLSQSFMVGLVGVTCGFGLGMLAVSYRNEFLFFMRRATGFELFPAQIYHFSQLPALIVPGDILLICGGSLLICLLAGLIPAWNAGRLKPVEALRHE
jgi:lipoprotein-releasing system permease protein